jgi:hypothetical protein
MMNAEAKREKTDHMALLHLENALPHLVQLKFDLMGIHQLSYPPYSPDIAPCDFWLFGDFKMKLEKMFFDTPAALLAKVKEILGNISITEWVKVFDEWKDRLKRCIDAEGEYL